MQSETQYYGDLVVPTDWSGIYRDGQFSAEPLLVSEPMSTAIVRIYTQEGFVIAADGRRRRTRDWKIISDHVQKVFPVVEPGRSIAYAMTGTTQIPAENEEILFDFIL